MPALWNPRHGAFAQALARGESIAAATAASGLKHMPQRMRERAETPALKERVAELKEQHRWGDNDELAKVFGVLMRLAESAGTLESGAAMTAAKGLLAEAARLRESVPRAQASAPAPERPRLPTLTREEWIATFAAPRP